MVEDEASHFSEHFAALSDNAHPHGPVQEVILPLHEEALDQLTNIAHKHGIEGTNEYKRSVALQIALDQFSDHCAEHASALVNELHFCGGAVKPRPLCVFKDTLDALSKLERELHCSETILLETAIRNASGDIILQPASA
jgi:hypothetical protein